MIFPSHKLFTDASRQLF